MGGPASGHNGNPFSTRRVRRSAGGQALLCAFQIVVKSFAQRGEFGGDTGAFGNRDQVMTAGGVGLLVPKRFAQEPPGPVALVSATHFARGDDGEAHGRRRGFSVLGQHPQDIGRLVKRQPLVPRPLKFPPRTQALPRAVSP